ncbi:MAG: AAA family ATPase [Prevotella sp.]
MIITIARQCGCGAIQLGQLLQQHYNIPLYTRKSLRAMAEEKGVLSQLDDFFEERPVDALTFAITSDYSDASVHLQDKTRNLICNLIGDRDCIIIGRCGNYIFRDNDGLVSVFLKGDVRARVKEIMCERGLTEAKARRFVENTDDCRLNYHRYYTGLQWGNAADYDLCIDNCRIEHVQTARLIIEYVSALGLK